MKVGLSNHQPLCVCVCVCLSVCVSPTNNFWTYVGKVGILVLPITSCYPCNANITERRVRGISMVIHLLCIQDVPGLNLDMETGYSDWCSSSFHSVLLGKCWDSTLKSGHDRFLPHQFISHLSPLHPTLYSLSQWKASLNKLQTYKMPISTI
jgi:hypothetical protein